MRPFCHANPIVVRVVQTEFLVASGLQIPPQNAVFFRGKSFIIFRINGFRRLITQRSEVQILPPQPSELVGYSLFKTPA